MNYPNVVSKLGLVEHPQDQSFFRRITPTQLRASGTETSLRYFKEQAVLLFVRAFAGEEEVNFDNYDVFLSYKDDHGDMMIIHNDEDLIAAMEENTDAGKIKILAQVREKPSAPGAQDMLLAINEAPAAAQGMQQNEASSPAVVSVIQSTTSPDSNVDAGPLQIFVRGAGTSAVDGVYSRGDLVSNVWSYSKRDLWNGKPCSFRIFRCTVSNSKRYWYLSIVPLGQLPGKKTDIDFYRAPVKDDCVHIPPRTGWIAVKEGRDPTPRLLY